MQQEYNNHLTFVVYDGMQNSVFESQVLSPLLKSIDEHYNLEVTLVSFEKEKPSHERMLDMLPAHDQFHVILCRRLPFFGKLSLWFAVYQLAKFLEIAPCHQVVARGPLAGWVALTALDRLAKKHPERLRKNTDDPFPRVMVQARGLCAEEYRYAIAHEPSRSSFSYWWHKFVYNRLHKIEYEVFRNKRKTDYPYEVALEAVSPALKDYLVEHFRADPAKISLAVKDIPLHVPQPQVVEWRQAVRAELGISPDMTVYCYSGSFKAWQCAAQTIAAFAFEYQQQKNSFMLVLTPDHEPFVKALETHAIPPTHFRVLRVKPQDLYRYLAAADYGMLYRETDIINWVSRPTKMLEYQAVGLKIIHNNTIAWLAQKK